METLIKSILRNSEMHVLEFFQSLVKKGEEFDILQGEMEHLKVILNILKRKFMI